MEMKKEKKRIRWWGILLIIFVTLAVAAVGGFFYLKWSGEKALSQHAGDVEEVITAPEHVVLEDDGQIVTYNGKKYRKNENIINILCMGVDKDSLQESGVTGENGQADTLLVVALDKVTGEMTMLNVSRDSMVDVELYNTEDEYVKTSRIQLCLAYAYGDGKETSCKNVIKSVSRLLYGMPIHAYAAIDLSAIPVLNDAIGGVEVTVLEDLTQYRADWAEGAVITLTGDDAESYVRARKSEGAEGVESNNNRMARQKQYLTNFIKKALTATKEDITVPVTLYQTVTPYMITDIGMSEVTYLATIALESGFSEQSILNVPGEVVMGEKYAEYHVDEEALYEIILDIYYDEM